jgi:hypothetical protein
MIERVLTFYYCLKTLRFILWEMNFVAKTAKVGDFFDFQSAIVVLAVRFIVENWVELPTRQ